MDNFLKITLFEDFSVIHLPFFLCAQHYLFQLGKIWWWWRHLLSSSCTSEAAPEMTNFFAAPIEKVSRNLKLQALIIIKLQSSKNCAVGRCICVSTLSPCPASKNAFRNKGEIIYLSWTPWMVPLLISGAAAPSEH